jgi:hypothetical protein
MGTSHHHAVFATPWSWNTETCWKSSHASSRAALYHFKNVFLFLHMFLMCLFRWIMSTGKHTTFTQCTEHLGKHSIVWNSVQSKQSTVFNSTSGTTITEAVNIQHISIFNIFRNTPTMSLSTVTTATWHFTLIHMLQRAAQYGGTEGQYWVPNPTYCTVKQLNLGSCSE